MKRKIDEVAIRLKKNEKVEKGNRGQDNRFLQGASGEGILKHNHNEGVQESSERSVIESSHMMIRLKPELLDRGSEIQHVQKLEPRYFNEKQLIESRQEAWDKLNSSNEGRILLEKVGGRENMVKIMGDGNRSFLTRAASISEKAGLPSDAVGRNVHKLGELYYMEKHPRTILEGKKLVEQRINYTDNQGKDHRVELDHVTRLPNGRAIISDFKRINLGLFERTSEGQRWTKWARETIGPNFRDKIRAGESPFFDSETNHPMPRDIRSGLNNYQKEVADHHCKQLDHYRKLFSEATGIDPAKISIAVTPYYGFN